MFVVTVRDFLERIDENDRVEIRTMPDEDWIAGRDETNRIGEECMDWDVDYVVVRDNALVLYV